MMGKQRREVNNMLHQSNAMICTVIQCDGADNNLVVNLRVLDVAAKLDSILAADEKIEG